jgi:hypothetical protein
MGLLALRQAEEGVCKMDSKSFVGNFVANFVEEPAKEPSRSTKFPTKFPTKSAQFNGIACQPWLGCCGSGDPRAGAFQLNPNAVELSRDDSKSCS